MSQNPKALQWHTIRVSDDTFAYLMAAREREESLHSTIRRMLDLDEDPTKPHRQSKKFGDTR